MKKLVIALLLLCACAFAETPQAMAIRNAKIVTVSGPVIAKGTVVVRNGLIEGVGENLPVPADAWGQAVRLAFVPPASPGFRDGDRWEDRR